jgi:uncharacterized protein YbaR (Trm112 family)
MKCPNCKKEITNIASQYNSYCNHCHRFYDIKNEKIKGGNNE